MITLSLSQILMDGLILSIAVGVVIIGSLAANARLWLHDYPAAMQAKVPPLTRRERQARLVVTALFLAAAVGALAYSGSRLLIANGGTVSFLTAYLHVFFVLNLFNLFDAVVIDWLLIAMLKPRFVILPGTEGMEYLFHDWGLHLRNYLKGILFCAVISLPTALIIAF
ncbi:MAG: hypothetical protein HZC41_05640 [Chloroflexi bacterium]|nr:hypothetical protein [Chloroflexota bacterium]